MTTNRWGWLRVVLLSLTVAGAPRVLHAEERRGFVIGGALGLGEVVTDDHEWRRFTRVSIPNLKVGGMLNPSLALFLYVPTGIHRRDGAWRAFEGVLLTAQQWLSARFWVLGGVGAQLDFPVFGTKPVGFYAGPGAAVAGGFDLVHLGAATVDLGTRLVAGTVKVEGERRNGAAVDAFVGLNWY